MFVLLSEVWSQVCILKCSEVANKLVNSREPKKIEIAKLHCIRVANEFSHRSFVVSVVEEKSESEQRVLVGEQRIRARLQLFNEDPGPARNQRNYLLDALPVHFA